MARLGLIFDLDDTLLESFSTYVALHQRVAGELGWPVPSRDDLVDYHGGWRATLGRLFPGRPIDAFVERYDTLADRHPYPAIEGAGRVLARAARMSIPCWIVTSRSRRRLALRMSQAGLSRHPFAGILCREDQPEPKPSGRCFEPIRADPRAAGRRLVYVGDRHEDGRAARAAGLPFVSVATGPETLRDGTQPPGDLELATVADLEPYVSDPGELVAAVGASGT
ncbi:MAG: HAD family hydrolase [Deltaproteobacteria bacterium]|nr:MAG: HAD family hydrolase [Deltaproteobacteria bacterium]